MGNSRAFKSEASYHVREAMLVHCYSFLKGYMSTHEWSYKIYSVVSFVRNQILLSPNFLEHWAASEEIHIWQRSILKGIQNLVLCKPAWGRHWFYCEICFSPIMWSEGEVENKGLSLNESLFPGPIFTGCASSLRAATGHCRCAYFQQTSNFYVSGDVFSRRMTPLIYE